MDDYMKLVPTMAVVGHYMLRNNNVLEFDATQFFKIIFGGDQLTVARMRGTQALRSTEETAMLRLDGILPVVEDCARMTLLKVGVS